MAALLTISCGVESPVANTAAVADRVANDIVAGRFEQVEAAVASSAKSVLSADTIRRVWDVALDVLGAYVRKGSPLVARAMRNDLFDYPLTFKGGTGHLQVAVNARGEVTGIVVRPGPPTGEFGK